MEKEKIKVLRKIPDNLARKDLFELKTNTVTNLIKARRLLYKTEEDQARKWQSYKKVHGEVLSLGRKLEDMQDMLVQVDDDLNSDKK